MVDPCCNDEHHTYNISLKAGQCDTTTNLEMLIHRIESPTSPLMSKEEGVNNGMVRVEWMACEV
jgi:hypothetical protein